MTDAAPGEAHLLLGSLADATGERTWRALEHTVDPGLAPTGDAGWVQRMTCASAVLAEVSARAGRRVSVDAVELLHQRATSRRLAPPGSTSPGGTCRLLAARDGWVALSLSRPDDWDLVPALLRIDTADWAAIEASVARTPVDELAARGGELGLAIGVLPAGDQPDDAQWHQRRSDRKGPWVIKVPASGREPRSLRRVVDLSALWAGPLCASLLRKAGASVVTVESTTRPDGARVGDPDLHRSLHDGNEFVTLDLGTDAGRAELHRLVDGADVVVSASRVRALQQLGLDPFTAVEQQPGLTWVGISAYGITGPWSNRIGYGDDTAVSGGLVTRKPTPAFVGDAVADPATGLYGAIAGLAVAMSGGGVVDIALREVAAHLARPHRAQP